MPEGIALQAIVTLLPLTAFMVVSQVNPYHALVIRGILGAVAALVYALLGAADVALTEALVGTMLSITLYAVAVRSSMSMRLGVLEDNWDHLTTKSADSDHPAMQLLRTLRQTLSKYHMRLELVPYPHPESLQTALIVKDIHAACLVSGAAFSSDPTLEDPSSQSPTQSDRQPPYHLQMRVQRLYELIQTDLPPTLASLDYIDLDDDLRPLETLPMDPPDDSSDNLTNSPTDKMINSRAETTIGTMGAVERLSKIPKALEDQL